MFRTLVLGAAASLVMIGAASADPIVGNWRTGSGERAAIAACGSEFCITVRSGKHSGKQIGKFASNGSGSYAGQITEPNEDKTYRGKAKLAGNTLTMSGCVLGGLICRGEDWSRL